MTLRGSTATLAALLPLLLAGCATETGAVDEDPPAGSNADSGGSSAPETKASQSPEPSNPKFGQAFTYDNGLTIRVGKPKKFQPSNTSAGAEGPGTALRFEVKVVNNTGSNYDVVADYVSMQSGNQEAEAIFDSAKGFNGTPNTPVLDGRESTYKLAFQVKNPRDLVMQYQPGDFALDAVIFVN